MAFLEVNNHRMSRLLNSGFHPHISMGYMTDPCDDKYADGNVAFRLVPNTNIASYKRARLGAWY